MRIWWAQFSPEGRGRGLEKLTLERAPKQGWVGRHGDTRGRYLYLRYDTTTSLSVRVSMLQTIRLSLVSTPATKKPYLPVSKLARQYDNSLVNTVWYSHSSKLSCINDKECKSWTSLYLLSRFVPTNEDRLELELQQWYQPSSKVFQKFSRAEVSCGTRSCKTESSRQSPQTQRSGWRAGQSCLLGL